LNSSMLIFHGRLVVASSFTPVSPDSTRLAPLDDGSALAGVARRWAGAGLPALLWSGELGRAPMGFQAVFDAGHDRGSPPARWSRLARWSRPRSAPPPWAPRWVWRSCRQPGWRRRQPQCPDAGNRVDSASGS
jgi:hypothetical protein